jgi:phosphoesterase RecJ-like protein
MYVSLADMRASGASGEDCEGLINWALGIHGVEATAFFREIPGACYQVSLRSKGRIDVGRIAQSFDGGGHCCASGHIIAGSLDLATGRVLAALRQALEFGSRQQAG